MVAQAPSETVIPPIDSWPLVLVIQVWEFFWELSVEKMCILAYKSGSEDLTKKWKWVGRVNWGVKNPHSEQISLYSLRV